MNHDQMLRALQADVDDWPEDVKAAGVKNAAGNAYRPVPRNNEVLRTPDNPQATYDYMLRAWADPDIERGSDAWYRIISQAGPQLTWEWFMVDTEKPYASLFDDELRERVRAALEADPGNAEWIRVSGERAQASADQEERIRRIQDDMRSGKRSRMSF